MNKEKKYIVPLKNEEYPINKDKYGYDESFYKGSLSHEIGAVLIGQKTEDPMINHYLSLTHKWFSEFTSLNPVVSEKEHVDFLTPARVFKRRTLPEGFWIKNIIDGIDESFCGPDMNSNYLKKSVNNLNRNVIFKVADDKKSLHSILTFYFAKDPEQPKPESEQKPESEPKPESLDKYHLYVEAFCGNQTVQIEAMNTLAEAMRKLEEAQTNEEKEEANLKIEESKKILNRFKGGIVLIYRLVDLCVYLGIKSIVLDAMTSKKTIDAYLRAEFKKPNNKMPTKRDLQKRMIKLKRTIDPSKSKIIPLQADVPPIHELSDMMSELALKAKQNMIPMTESADGLYLDQAEMVPTTTFLTVHINPDEYMNYKTKSGREIKFPKQKYSEYTIFTEDMVESPAKRTKKRRHNTIKSKTMKIHPSLTTPEIETAVI